MDYHGILRNELIEFTKDNNCVDTRSWSDPINVHYFIAKENEEYLVAHAIMAKTQGVVYFPNESSAEIAIAKVVKPFAKQHKDFIW